MTGSCNQQLDRSVLNHQAFPAIGLDRIGPYNIKEINELERTTLIDFTVFRAARQTFTPQQILVILQNDQLRLTRGVAVTVHQHYFLKTANVVGVAVSRKITIHIPHAQTHIVQCQGTLGTAINQHMMIPLDHQDIGLAPPFAKCGPHADKNHAQMTIRLQGKRFPLLAYFVNFEHRQTTCYEAYRLQVIGWYLFYIFLQLETIQLKYATKKIAVQYVKG
jgi:hypothetical protein